MILCPLGQCSIGIWMSNTFLHVLQISSASSREVSLYLVHPSTLPSILISSPVPADENHHYASTTMLHSQDSVVLVIITRTKKFYFSFIWTQDLLPLCWMILQVSLGKLNTALQMDLFEKWFSTLLFWFLLASVSKSFLSWSLSFDRQPDSSQNLGDLFIAIT